MDTYTLDSAKDRPRGPATTDAMNQQAMDQLLVDLALCKRATARAYVRKRWALRELVRMGVFTPEEARSVHTPRIIELKTTWRAARYLLREALRV